MRKGEKCLLICKPEYAYGDHGSPPKIPAGATLNFEVELLSWKSHKVGLDLLLAILRQTTLNAAAFRLSLVYAMCFLVCKRIFHPSSNVSQASLWFNLQDLTGDGGIIKTVVIEGQGWKTPGKEDELKGNGVKSAG